MQLINTILVGNWIDSSNSWENGERMWERARSRTIGKKKQWQNNKINGKHKHSKHDREKETTVNIECVLEKIKLFKVVQQQQQIIVFFFQ